MKRLIILITASDKDRGLLLLNEKFPDKEQLFVECDRGQDFSLASAVAAERLLCVILLSDLKTNTHNLNDVLNQSALRDFDAVVGTHNLKKDVNKDPDNVLDVESLREKYPSLIISAYSTSQFPFIKKWCRELGKTNPDESIVRVHFDKLFQLLMKKEALSYQRRIRLICHRIDNLLQPIDNELHGLHETDFAEDYWTEVVQAYAGEKGVDTLQEVKSWIYSGRPDQDAVERVVLEAGLDFPEAKARMDAAWSGVTALLPKEGEPVSGTVKEILANLGVAQGREEVRQRCQSYNNPYHKWLVSLREKLAEVRRAVPEKED